MCVFYWFIFNEDSCIWPCEFTEFNKNISNFPGNFFVSKFLVPEVWGEHSLISWPIFLGKVYSLNCNTNWKADYWLSRPLLCDRVPGVIENSVWQLCFFPSFLVTCPRALKLSSTELEVISLWASYVKERQVGTFSFSVICLLFGVFWALTETMDYNILLPYFSGITG